MSLLDETINEPIESAVMLRSFLRDYDPAVRNIPCIGGARAGRNTTAKGIYALNAEAITSGPGNSAPKGKGLAHAPRLL